MSTCPKLFHPDRALLAGVVLTAVTRSLLAFIFEISSFSFAFIPIVFLDGLGLGFLYTSFEVMIPEVVLYDHHRTSVLKEGHVYGWVDSCREVALAIAFAVSGDVIDRSTTGGWVPLAARLLCGGIPLALLLLWLIGVYSWNRRIILTDHPDGTRPQPPRRAVDDIEMICC